MKGQVMTHQVMYHWSIKNIMGMIDCLHCLWRVRCDTMHLILEYFFFHDLPIMNVSVVLFFGSFAVILPAQCHAFLSCKIQNSFWLSSLSTLSAE